MTPATAPRLGPALARARDAAGWATQREAAERLGMHRPAYCRLEHADDARWSTALRLIAGLGLGLEHLFPEEWVLDAARRLLRARAGKTTGKNSGNNSSYPIATGNPPC
jgi:transcriptional regulator with XRE-family HTH domain